MKRLLLFIFLVFSIPCYASSYSCTGFFINSTGAIGTAAHCVDFKNINNIYVKMYNGGRYKAYVVAADFRKDVAILQLKDRNFSVPYFKLNTHYWAGQTVVTTGYPNPQYWGYNLHRYTGISRSNSPSDYVYFNLFSDGGSSGSPIVDLDGNVISVLTDGWDEKGKEGTNDTGGQPIQYLLDLSEKVGLNLEVKDSRINLDPNDVLINRVLSLSASKTVLILILVGD